MDHDTDDARVIPEPGQAIEEELEYSRTYYMVLHYSDHIEVLDAGDEVFRVPVTSRLSPDIVRALLSVYYEGRKDGERRGRLDKAYELREALGIKPCLGDCCTRE